ncbi:hypothetical protein ACP70R_022863 [Stipagrostis hirtigluma subsp. patula]
MKISRGWDPLPLLDPKVRPWERIKSVRMHGRRGRGETPVWSSGRRSAALRAPWPPRLSPSRPMAACRSCHVVFTWAAELASRRRRHRSLSLWRRRPWPVGPDDPWTDRGSGRSLSRPARWISGSYVQRPEWEWGRDDDPGHPVLVARDGPKLRPASLSIACWLSVRVCQELRIRMASAQGAR